MKVAIVGAGLSGLSCAVMLEKYGIEPTIFEKADSVGHKHLTNMFSHNIPHNPFSNPLEYINNMYNLELKPKRNFKDIKVHTANEHIYGKGNIGILCDRGKNDNSLENQLLKSLRTKINFNNECDIGTIKNQYDYVVVSTGDIKSAKQFNNYNSDYKGHYLIFDLSGNFLNASINFWINHELSPNGYASFIPITDNTAYLLLFCAVKLNSELTDKNIICEWALGNVKDKFGEVNVTNQYGVDNYEMGICPNPKLENMYFIGNCAGIVTPMFGYGQIKAIFTGIFCAYDIVGCSDYKENLKPFIAHYQYLDVIRRALDKLDNDTLDFFARSLNPEIIQPFVNIMGKTPNSPETIRVISNFIKPFISPGEKQIIDNILKGDYRACENKGFN